jgi:hypothetical protein
MKLWRRVPEQTAAAGRQSRAGTYARVAFVCVVTVLAFGAVASFGGVGNLSSTAVTAAKPSAGTPAAPTKHPARRVVSGSAADDQYNPKKVTICHKPQSGHSVTITISRAALPAHLAHGDTTGAC